MFIPGFMNGGGGGSGGWFDIFTSNFEFVLLGCYVKILLLEKSRSRLVSYYVFKLP